MTDVREDILARLAEVVAGLPGLNAAYRNEMDIPAEQCPAGNVLDGDEETVSGNDGSRPANRPLVVEMTPEITITQQADGIGSALTAFRRELMPLVLNDATLNALVGSNGKIGYRGCTTTFGWQEAWFGVLSMQFEFKYALKPDDL